MFARPIPSDGAYCCRRAPTKYASRVLPLGPPRYRGICVVGILQMYGHWGSRLVVCHLSRSQLIEKLALWLYQYPISGANDKTVEGVTEAWCIAKIQRLIGLLDPPVNNSDYRKEFSLAEILESTTFTHSDTKLETQDVKVGILRQELERFLGPKVSPELIDFIGYLLVVDHMKSPTAVEALQHLYLQ